MTRWTEDQQKVIDYRNRNILVSAAAGSGKTAVLVERIIKRITEEEHPIDIDKLLVVTFTKAAAAEMRERISQAIDKCLEKHPENENLQKQQTLLHNALITTIDSFCLYIVRNHFQEIDLEPNFRIADQGELKLLEMDVLNEVFEQEYARTKGMNRENEPFLQLVDAYSDKRSNRAVKEMVAKIYRQSASNPWPKEWINALAQPYQIQSKEELAETTFLKEIMSYIKILITEMYEKVMLFREIALHTEGVEKYADTLEKDMALLETMLEAEDWERLEKSIVNCKFARIATIDKKKVPEHQWKPIADVRDAIKKEIDDLKKNYFTFTLEQQAAQLNHMRPIVEELLRLSLLYADAMEVRKKEKRLMDFSDIEHAALRIFVDEHTKECRPTALEYRKQLEEIMIDEYQDSNQVQEEILRAIAREDNRFMVGDVKQSIYRFRMARPELFMEKFETYEKEESKNQRIDLCKNFRSRKEVLEFTNDIFYKIMDQDLGKVKYDADAALYTGATYPQAEDRKAEVLLYEAEGFVDESTAVDEENTDQKQMEARMIAEKILELKQTMQIYDKRMEQMRPLQNRDIVILLRSLQGWGDVFAPVLADCGIPAHVTTSTGYFSAMEVQTVLSFLKILDNPYQDIPMAAVLKSAIVGLENEELAEISLREETSGFAEAALLQMQEATEGKLYYFYQLYQELRSRVSDTPIHQLIDMVLEQTRYGDYVKALPAGTQRKANLDMLLEKAIAYEKTSYKGLFHFIRYIDQLQKYEVDFGEADIIGENEDVVRIMTIHKSKGLEFPVVFVAGISKKFNEMDARDVMVIHPDLGLGMDEKTIKPRVKRKCMTKTEIASRIRRDNLGEELRVLYVAMTRAKEKLILTGAVKKQEDVDKKAMGMLTKGKPLSFAQRNKATSYLDWIASAVLSYPDKYALEYKNSADFVLVEAEKIAKQQLEKEKLWEEIAQADDALAKVYQEQISYQYPYHQEISKKSKYSVSELKHESMLEKYDTQEGLVEIPEFLLEEREPYIPEFAKDLFEGKGMEHPQGVNIGALRGTAVHRVMECMHFAAFLEADRSSAPAITDFINAELERMKEQKLIGTEQLELVSKRALYRFFQSKTALRMAQADARGDLFNEKAFVMDYEGVLVQGIIDVFWFEDDRIVLLDYKTDRVTQAEELINRYHKQLELYADALRRVFSTAERQITETENLLYSFCLNETIICK